ncbi:MAG TPA: EpsI family protein [Bryobacteraceae bacterium]|nr:EpsI family protein [Bryobacteraceae bacterium]
MNRLNSNVGFLKSKQTRMLTGVLIAQAVLFYSMSRGEKVATNRPLAQFPVTIGAWQVIEEGVIEKEILDVLKADEILTRTYARPGSRLPSNLFVAYFRSQRTGQAPHSPKNCLPGSGWVPSNSDTVSVPIAGREPIQANRYLVSKGENKSVVLYWYQSRDRVVPNEYHAKFYVVADSIRYNRTDTALVRVVVPVIDNDEKTATQEGIEFVQTFFNPLRQHFPS